MCTTLTPLPAHGGPCGIWNMSDGALTPFFRWQWCDPKSSNIGQTYWSNKFILCKNKKIIFWKCYWKVMVTQKNYQKSLRSFAYTLWGNATEFKWIQSTEIQKTYLIFMIFLKSLKKLATLLSLGSVALTFCDCAKGCVFDCSCLHLMG